MMKTWIRQWKWKWIGDTDSKGLVISLIEAIKKGWYLEHLKVGFLSAEVSEAGEGTEAMR